MRALVPTHGLGCDVPFPRKLPAPPARAGKANTEALRCLMPKGSGSDGTHDAFTQIDDKA